MPKERDKQLEEAKRLLEEAGWKLTAEKIRITPWVPLAVFKEFTRVHKAHGQKQTDAVAEALNDYIAKHS